MKRALLCVVLAVSIGTALVAAPASGQPDPDAPFGTPQYLIHITGHGTTSGDVKDDALIIHPSEPDGEGHFLVADGSGGTYGYGSDYHAGPFNRPSEVCAAAAGRLKGTTYIVSFSGSARDVDCAAFGPTASSPGDTSDPSASSASDPGTTDTLPEPAPSCNVRGHVIDYFGDPVPDIHIALRAGGLSFETSTLDDGTYQFAEIGDDPAGGVFDSRSQPVTVALVDEEWTHAPQRYVVYYRQQGAVLSADPFLIPQDGDCTRDFDMRSIPTNYISTGPPINEWPDMTQLYQGIHRAWALADMLGIDITYGLPLQVRGFCDLAGGPTACSESEASFLGTTSSGSQIVDRPLISFGPSESRLLSLNWPDNREYHEFGHYVLAAASNGVPDGGDDVNHAGYANPSSSDSWAEGFAEFWASMVVKYIDHRQRPEIYRWNQGHLPSNSPNAPPVPGSNLLDVWPARVDEEFAIASLLFQLESLDVASAAPPRAPRTLEVTGYTEINDPTFGRLLVGNVVNRTVEGASIGTIVGANFYDAQGLLLDASYGSSIPANLGADGGTGVFVLPVPKGLTTYADVAVIAYEGRPPATVAPPPPLDVSLAEIWQAIIGYPSSKPLAAGHTLDVDDLYQALHLAFGGRGTIVEGFDTIDQLFIERGLFEDPDGDGLFVPGDRLGMTSHPAYGDQEQCAGGVYIGCSPTRIPRTGYLGGAALTATVSISGASGAPIAATGSGALVYAQVMYPSPRQDRSYGYVVSPDAQGAVQLAVPPPGTGATLVLIAIADGHQPAVLGTIAADTFWDDAAAHHGQPFLTYATTLAAGDFTIPSGAGATTTTTAPAADATTTAATDDATASTRRSGGVGAGSVLLLIGGLVVAIIVGRRIGRGRVGRQ